MTRVAHVISRLVHGGAELQLLELVRRSSLDHVVIELDGASRDAAVRVLVRLRRALNRCEPDVVFAWLDRSQLAVAVAAPGGVPLVANVRGMPRQRRAHRNLAMRFALRRFDAIVANSHASLDAATAEYDLRDRRCAVIPNGVNPVDCSQPRRLSSGEERSPRFAFIGRADPAKGLDTLLAAMQRLQDVEIVLVGAGVPERAKAILGNRAGVTLLPRTPDPWSLLGKIDALVVPSRSEGSPNVVLEAFVRRVPVIATAVGGTKELLANGRGTLVPPGDPGALASAMATFPDRVGLASQCAERAYDYVMRAHSWLHVAAAYDSLALQLTAKTS